MYDLLKEIFDWSEVWALLIPIAVLVWKRNIAPVAKPLTIYVFISLLFNFLQDYFWKAELKFSFSVVPGDNLFFYNILSITRFAFFSWFFIQLKQPFLTGLKKMLPVFFAFFVIINFYFFEKFTTLSSRTMALEGGGILFYCLLYFLYLFMQDEAIDYKKDPVFFMVTGISVYYVINFPIFLFYKSLSVDFTIYAIDIWGIHNITFILLCIFIARFFYAVSRK